MSFNSHAQETDTFASEAIKLNKIRDHRKLRNKNINKIWCKSRILCQQWLLLEPSMHFIGYQVKRFNDQD